MNINDIEKKIVEKKSKIDKVEIDATIITIIIEELFSDEKYSNIIADRNYIYENIGVFFPGVFYNYRKKLKYYKEKDYRAILGFKSGNMIYHREKNKNESKYSTDSQSYIETFLRKGFGAYDEDVYEMVVFWTQKPTGIITDIEKFKKEVGYNKFTKEELIFFTDLCERIQSESNNMVSKIEKEIKILESSLLEEKKKIDLQNEERRKQEIEERNRQELETKNRIQENYHNFRKISQDCINKVKEMRNDIVIKYDVDGNELVDIVEENVYVGIIRNNNEVLEKKIGADKVHKLVKLSIYLNKKRDNIQNLYGCFLGMYNDFYRKEGKQEICIAKVLEESDLMFKTNISKFYFSKEEEAIVKDIDKALSDEVNTYKTMLFHSMSMVVSAKKGDLITFFEIYEVFDKLGVFDSNWENEVSNKLSEVSNKLSDVTNKLSEISNKLSEVSNKLLNLQAGIGVLIQSINRMNDEIVGELISLNYVMESSIGSLENSVNYELQGIKSSVNFNNLLTSVNTYQLSKLNSKTNKLLKGR